MNSRTYRRLVLKEVAGFRTKDISDCLHIPENSIISSLSRARALLRTMLSKKYPEYFR